MAREGKRPARLGAPAPSPGSALRSYRGPSGAVAGEPTTGSARDAMAARKGNKSACFGAPAPSPSAALRSSRGSGGAVVRDPTTVSARESMARIRDQSTKASSPEQANVVIMPAGSVTRTSTRRRATVVLVQDAINNAAAATAMPTPRNVVCVITRAAAARLRRALATRTKPSVTESGTDEETATTNGDAATAAPSLPGAPVNTKSWSRRNPRALSSSQVGHLPTTGGGSVSTTHGGCSSAGRGNGGWIHAMAQLPSKLQPAPGDTEPSDSSCSHDKPSPRSLPNRSQEELPPVARPVLPPDVAARLLVVAAAHERAVAAAAATKTECRTAGLGQGASSSARGSIPVNVVGGMPSGAVVKVEAQLETPLLRNRARRSQPRHLRNGPRLRNGPPPSGH